MDTNFMGFLFTQISLNLKISSFENSFVLIKIQHPRQHFPTIIINSTYLILFIVYSLPSRHGNGAGWGRLLPSPSPYPILIYLHVTLLISNGDEKLNLILVPDGFGYPHLIPVPALNNFFNKK